MCITLCIDWCNGRSDRWLLCKVIAYLMRGTVETLFWDKMHFIVQWLCSNDFRILCRDFQSHNFWTYPMMVRVCWTVCRQMTAILLSSWESVLASIATCNAVCSCEQASCNTDGRRATTVAIVILASCEHISVTRNRCRNEWMKRSASPGQVWARMGITSAPGGGQRIVFFYWVIIWKTMVCLSSVYFGS